MKQFKHKIILVVILSLGIINLLKAQVGENSDLFKTLKAKDSLIFNVGFNHCDVSQFKNLVADDFEFYHDKSGVLNSKEEFINSIENGLCSKTNPYKARRELITGSLEVYPLYKNGELYGALQNGKHKFFEQFEGKETAGSIAQFSHLWILEQKQWKIKRVLSFNHQEP